MISRALEGRLCRRVIGNAEHHISVLLGSGHERVEILHIDARVVKDTERARKLSGSVAYLYTHHVGGLDKVALIKKGGAGRSIIVYYETKNTEILGVRNGKRSDIYIMSRQRLGDAHQRTLFVFDKYCQLFDCHNSSPICRRIGGTNTFEIQIFNLNFKA